MAIHLETKTPNKLRNAFKKAIDDGHIVTWSYDEDGDFTHTPEQWVKKAWLRPRVTKEARLSFFIVCPKEGKISSVLYAVYHGRFIESMLQHCDALFTEARASSMPEEDDNVG